MLPMQSIELAVEEMRYARNELGMRAGFLRPNPYNNRMLGHRDYDVFWAAAQDLDFSIGIHEGTGGMPAVGVDRFESFGARHMVSHTMEMMLAALSVIWGGVCERFPKVRVGFMESGGGWMAQEIFLYRPGRDGGCRYEGQRRISRQPLCPQPEPQRDLSAFQPVRLNAV